MITYLDGVVEIMGGKAVVPQPVRTNLDLIHISRSGLSIRALTTLGKRMGFSHRELAAFLAISESTLQRRLRQKSLSQDEADKTIQISTVVAKGLAVFEDVDDFRAWLDMKNPALGGIKPIELMDSSLGREQLLDLLNRIDYGIYS